jgi:integrating conjugative element protein (TIGR03765 family)
MFPVLVLATQTVMAGSVQHTAHEPLTVIYRGTQIIEAAPFYHKLDGVDPTQKITEAYLRQDRAARSSIKVPVTQQSRFPLQPKNLTPADPVARTIENLYRPFFVVGMDPASIAWLRSHYSQLQQLGAFGLVVEANSWEAWQNLKREAAGQGVTLSLQPGDAIARLYAITTYPVLFRGQQ